MAEIAPLRVCASSALEDGGLGVRFVADDGEPAFAIRFDGTVHAYLNRCAHVPMELDWRDGEFFDPDGQILLCATHGAQYLPDTGLCVGGPCRGASLTRVAVVERENAVFWLPRAPTRP